MLFVQHLWSCRSRFRLPGDDEEDDDKDKDDDKLEVLQGCSSCVFRSDAGGGS